MVERLKVSATGHTSNRHNTTFTRVQLIASNVKSSCTTEASSFLAQSTVIGLTKTLRQEALQPRTEISRA